VDAVVLVRPDAPLFDANDRLDITSSEHLGKLARDLSAQGVQLCLAHVHGPALRMATEMGLVEAIGAEHIFANIDAAIAWAHGRDGS
jgi:MFS superfamily sulfate permease-like transporter